MSSRLSVVPQAPEWDEEEATTQVVALDKSNGDSGIWRLPAPAPVLHPRCPEHLVYATYSPLVRRIALKPLRSLPRTISMDDIISAGWVGMTEALNRRPADMPDDQFEAYASYRIRGAILDYLRALDPLSRRLRGLAREIHRVTRELSHRYGRVPTQEEIASEMKVSLAHLQRTVSDIQEAGLDRLDGTSAGDAPSADPSPEELTSRHQMIATVRLHMKKLPERLQVVLSLHYERECSLREIGEILGVTESRVCQLHGEAVAKIRAQIEGRPLSARRARVGAARSEALG